MANFIIALMMCAGTNCEMTQPEPQVAYPTFDACTTATTTKAPQLQAYLKQHPPRDGQQPSFVCLSEQATIIEVEEPQEALDTELVHAEPDATSAYVGVVEKGVRTLVTGRVAGTQWVRVMLKDGATGFVFADHLRKLTEATPAPVAPAPAPPPPPRPPTTLALTTTPAPPPAAPGGDCAHCPTMVTIAAGTLTMGSNDDATEKPIHKVTIPAFALARTEATVAEWMACADAGACGYKPPPADGDPTRMPMTNLSFTDASDYIAWLRKQTGKPFRLPSEAEWEYAARAGATTRYPWGDQVGSGHADCDGCGGAHGSRQPEPIGTYPANRLGLVGMSGGVAEWVEDCWHATYQGAPSDGAAWQAQGCASHVLRGGSWKNGPRDITVSSRNFYDTTVRYLTNGVRVALGGK